MSVRQELFELYHRDGVITPAAVVDKARDPDTALHSQIDWDNEEAGGKWRLHQARMLIVRYDVVVETAPETNIRVRQFVNTGPSSYTPIDDAFADPASREMVMHQATRELAALRRKYDQLVDFDAVIQAHLAKPKGRRKVA